FALRLPARPRATVFPYTTLFRSVGALVPTALKALDPGGTVVCAGIHMSDIPSFPYELLWMERHIRSVANLTRRDGEEFLQIAPRSEEHTSELQSRGQLVCRLLLE